MEKRVHFFVSRKNLLTWLMAFCMIGSAVARIVIFSGVEGVGTWSQIVLPIAAALLYAFIALASGKELFYKTAIPVWMTALYSAFWVADNIQGGLVTWLFWIALIFFAYLYTRISAGKMGAPLGLLLVIGVPLAMILYYQWDLLLKGYLVCLPDVLMLFGAWILVFAIRIAPAGEYHPTWGDRTDGRRVRTLSPKIGRAHV